MNANKFSLIFIFALLLTACSTDNPVVVEDNNVLIEEAATRIGGDVSCYITKNSLQLSIEYVSGLTFLQKRNLRNKYKDFVGRTCLMTTSGTTEIWVVDTDIYYEFCQICEDNQNCCRSEQMEEEEDDINKVELFEH